MSKAGERLIVKFLGIIAACQIASVLKLISDENGKHFVDKFEHVVKEMQDYLEVNTDV